MSKHKRTKRKVLIEKINNFDIDDLIETIREELNDFIVENMNKTLVNQIIKWGIL